MKNEIFEMDRNVNEKIAEWGLHNGYEPGMLTVVNATRKLARTSVSRARKYFNRFRNSMSASAVEYVESEVFNNGQ